MAPTTEPSLTSLRWLLFLFFGGVGSLLPFLSLHIQAIGLNLEEARIITIISPLIAFFGPVIVGRIVDNFYVKNKSNKDVKIDDNKCIRTVLSSTILLSAIFYSLLLSVPPVDRLDPRQPAISFICGENGASLVQERCNDELGCYHYSENKLGVISLSNCQFDCSSPYPNFGALESAQDDVSLETEMKNTVATSTTTIPTEVTTLVESEIEHDMDMNKFFGEDNTEIDDEDVDFGSGEEPQIIRSKREDEDPIISEHIPSPPHICYGSSVTRLCSVFTPHSSSVEVNISLKRPHEEEQSCYYPLGVRFSCRIPPDLDKPREACKVVCDLEDAYVTGSLLLQSQCQRTVGDPALTFYLYLLIRSLGDFFTAIAISLLMASTLTVVRLNVGLQFIFPAVSYALFASLSGFLRSYIYSYVALKELPPYIFEFFTFGVCSVISVFILVLARAMPIGNPDWYTTGKWVRLQHRNELLGVLLVLTLLGILWGPYFSHVPWHLIGTEQPEAYIGRSLALGALLSIPFIVKANFVIDYCGYSNLLIVAFAFYILRYTGLLFLRTPWVLLITGGMEVFTLSMMIFSAMFYIRELVPKRLTFTAQSLGFAAHFCLGNGLGCLFATILSPNELTIDSTGASNATSMTDHLEDTETRYHLLYCTGAIFAAVVASIYFVAYHCFFKQKCRAPSYRKANTTPPAVQDNNGNGTYTPLMVIGNGQQRQVD